MFTTNQLQVLAVLLSRPEGELSMSELGEALGKKPGVFQRGINSLEQRGIVASRRRGNMRLFRINTEYPLFDEIKSIVAKACGVVGALKDLANSVPGIAVAAIYGSYAKHAMRADSDIDMLVVSDSEAAEAGLLKALPAVERRLRTEVNYKLYSTSEFRRKRESEDAFPVNVLNGPHIPLKGVL